MLCYMVNTKNAKQLVIVAMLVANSILNRAINLEKTTYVQGGPEVTLYTW